MSVDRYISMYVILTRMRTQSIGNHIYRPLRSLLSATLLQMIFNRNLVGDVFYYSI